MMKTLSKRTKPAAIRVTQILRDSNHPEGIVVETRFIRPLTTAERKTGVKDEFTSWTRAFGNGEKRKPRGKHPSDWWDAKPKPEKKPVNVDEAIQLQIAKTMEADFERMARKLVSQCFISVDDKEFFKALMFDRCRDAYPKFNPEKRSLRGFMKDVLHKWRSDFIAYLNSGKRKDDFIRLSVRQRSVDEEDWSGCYSDAESDSDIETATVSEETLAHPRSLKELEFNLAWSDLEDLCDPDERLALHILYRGGTVEELASHLKINPASARRNVVGTLQLKVDLCFGFSEHHHLKFILARR